MNSLPEPSPAWAMATGRSSPEATMASEIERSNGGVWADHPGPVGAPPSCPTPELGPSGAPALSATTLPLPSSK